MSIVKQYSKNTFFQVQTSGKQIQSLEPLNMMWRNFLVSRANRWISFPIGHLSPFIYYRHFLVIELLIGIGHDFRPSSPFIKYSTSYQTGQFQSHIALNRSINCIIIFAFSKVIRFEKSFCFSSNLFLFIFKIQNIVDKFLMNSYMIFQEVNYQVYQNLFTNFVQSINR